MRREGERGGGRREGEGGRERWGEVGREREGGRERERDSGDSGGMCAPERRSRPRVQHIPISKALLPRCGRKVWIGVRAG